MNGIGPIFETPGISLPPYWPPYTWGNQFPPSLWLLLPPLLIQQLRRSNVCSGMAQLQPVMSRNKFHIWAVYSQCKKRCLFGSSVTIHRKHLETNCLFFFCSTSWVKASPFDNQPSEALNFGRNATFLEIIPLALTICFHLETSCVGTLYRKYPVTIVFPKRYINLCSANRNLPYFSQ